MMNIDYNAVTAWVAVVTALIAITAVWIEGRRARFSQGLDVLLKLSDQFNSEIFVKRRRLVAKGLQDENTKRGDKWEVAVGELLDHFQLVGMLLRKGVLDKELVHSEYYYWVSYYFYYFKEIAIEWRRIINDPTVWDDADYLYRELTTVERKYRRDLSTPSEDNLKEFLSSEANL